MENKRSFERKKIDISSTYEWNGIKCPCFITDISSGGMGLRVKGTLAFGDIISVKLGKENIKATVVRVDGAIVGTSFKDLPEKQLYYILDFEMELQNSQ